MMESIVQSALLEGQQSLFVVAVIFATGLLTSLTPCVYPMLPITVSVIGDQANNRREGILFSLLYVFGLALVYAALGMFAATTGQLFGVVASHPVTLLLVAVFCLFMAMYILGWITLPVTMSPGQFTSRFAPLNVFVAGCVSGLVMAPCTSPVLGMLLMYVAGNGDPLWAALLMFVFAFGMSALLVLAGSISGFVVVLPRSGTWLTFMPWLLAAPMFGVALYLTVKALF